MLVQNYEKKKNLKTKKTIYFNATSALEKGNKKALPIQEVTFGSPWGNRTPLSRMKILRPNR